MDPYSSPYIIPNNSPHDPFPHSPLRTTQSLGEFVNWEMRAVTVGLEPKLLDRAPCVCRKNWSDATHEPSK